MTFEPQEKPHGTDLLTEQAQKALFDALIDGRLRSGQFLSIPQLVSFLDLPIAAVRDAVKHAGSFGLIESLPKRGVLVMEAGPEITRQCMDVRLLHDQEGARRRIASGNLSGLETLRAAHLELRATAASDTGENLSPTAIRTDLSLHDFLAAGLGNPVAERAYAINRVRIAVIQNTRPFVRNRIVPAMDEHLAIMDALETGDAAAAADRLAEHFENTLLWWGV